MMNKTVSILNQPDYTQHYNQRIFNDLHVDAFTDAPQKAFVQARFKHDAAEVFKNLADHESMNKWVPMINHRVEVNHRNSKTPGNNDVGSVRVCNFGGDILTETIRYWRQGEAYAYSVKENRHSPIIEHLGVITVEQGGRGQGCVVTWRQFFRPKPWSLKAKMMPLMMPFILKKALKNLAQKMNAEQKG